MLNNSNDFNQYQQTIVLPQYFQSAPVVFPCLDRNPKNRPSCSEVVSALDKTINNILQSVRRLLPQEDIELLAQLSSGSSKDSLESDIQKLYRLLLNKNPNEVDSLINRALNPNNQENEQRNNQNNNSRRSMNNQHQNQNNQYQNQNQNNQNQNNQYQNNGYGYNVKKEQIPQQYVPLNMERYQKQDMYQQENNQKQNNKNQRKDNNHKQENNHSQQDWQKQETRPLKDEITTFLENLTINELKKISTQCNIPFSTNRGELITSIKSSCGDDDLKSILKYELVK